MFGGLVVPRWESAPPGWVEWVNQAAAFTLSDRSLPAGKVDPEHIFGPNMAIRSRVFEEGIRFDTSIGPSGPSYPMGSETELVLRLGRLGHLAWHAPEAVVEHFVRREQLTKTWVFQRAIRFGRGQYRLFGLAGPGRRKTLADIPLYLIRKELKQTTLLVLALLFFRREGFFNARWRFNFFWGQIVEARNLARASAPARRLS